jgi:hypothetical protein
MVTNPTKEKLILLKNTRVRTIHELDLEEAYFTSDITNAFKALTLGVALGALYNPTVETSRNITNGIILVAIDPVLFTTNTAVLVVNSEVTVTPE